MDHAGGAQVLRATTKKGSSKKCTPQRKLCFGTQLLCPPPLNVKSWLCPCIVSVANHNNRLHSRFLWFLLLLFASFLAAFGICFVFDVGRNWCRRFRRRAVRCGLNLLHCRCNTKRLSTQRKTLGDGTFKTHSYSGVTTGTRKTIKPTVLGKQLNVWIY